MFGNAFRAAFSDLAPGAPVTDLEIMDMFRIHSYPINVHYGPDWRYGHNVWRGMIDADEAFRGIPAEESRGSMYS